MNLNKIKFGFTLAEVLITLSIIGVVAAMTIPILYNNYQKRVTVSKLQKTYSILSQSVKKSALDNGTTDTWDWGYGGTLTARQSFDLYWAPYLKIMKYCDSAADCGYTKTNNILNINGANSGSFIFETISRTAVILVDGSLLDIVAGTAGNSSPAKVIFVDINGGQGKNTYGIDVFRFVLDSKKGLLPDGLTGTPGTNCTTSSDFWCAAKILHDGWEIKSDYPYFN